MMRLLDPLFTSDRMREVFSDETRLQRMLDFEAALARALVRAKIAPQSAATAIEAQCDVKRFSVDAISQAAAQAGNLAIPLVTELTEQVARADEKAAGFVHYGATSQDVIDTALVLQVRAAFDDTARELTRVSKILRRLATEHRNTILAGRTWLQQASPITLGLKCAAWLDAIERHRERFAEIKKRVEVLQFGGAVGTLAALGADASKVTEALGAELKLGVPDISWHAQRDRVAEAATTYGLLVGTLGKIASDISLMSQTEIGELTEPLAPGRGGSSTLPQKRNPVACAVVLAAAVRVPPLVATMLTAMVQEYERGLGGWHAEWETLPEICSLSAGALSHLAQVLDKLEIHPDAMARNLSATKGLVMAEAVSMALAKHVGKSQSHQLVEQAAHSALDSGKPFLDTLAAATGITRYLPPEELKRLLDPKNYLGSSAAIVDRVVAASKRNSH